MVLAVLAWVSPVISGATAFPPRSRRDFDNSGENGARSRSASTAPLVTRRKRTRHPQAARPLIGEQTRGAGGGDAFLIHSAATNSVVELTKFCSARAAIAVLHVWGRRAPSPRARPVGNRTLSAANLLMAAQTINRHPATNWSHARQAARAQQTVISQRPHLVDSREAHPLTSPPASAAYFVGGARRSHGGADRARAEGAGRSCGWRCASIAVRSRYRQSPG